jgi:hypothetical protein
VCPAAHPGMTQMAQMTHMTHFLWKSSTCARNFYSQMRHVRHACLSSDPPVRRFGALSFRLGIASLNR